MEPLFPNLNDSGNCPKSFLTNDNNLSPVESNTVSSTLFAISEQKKSGIILQKKYYAEFLGPGAAIGTPLEEKYANVILIGSPTLVPIETRTDRQRAYSRRIQWMRWLEKIASSGTPTQRAEKLLSSFEAFFGADLVAQLPGEVLALLIGVFPETMQAVQWEQNQLGKGGKPMAVSSWKPIAIDTLLQGDRTMLAHKSPVSLPSPENPPPKESFGGLGVSSRLTIA